MLSEKMTRKISLFLILFLASSYTICNDLWSSAVTIALWLFTAIILLLRCHKIRYRQLVVGLVLILTLGISSFVNSEDMRTFFVLVYSYLVLILYSSQVDFCDFIDDYQKIMLFLCEVSLIGYVAFLTFPQLHNLLSPVNNAGTRATNMIIYAASKHNTRNMGMFWEPGAFQTFINLALLFEISKEKVNKKTVALYCVTILTTYSTTGYLAMALVLALQFFRKKISIKRKIILFSLLLVIIGVCLFLPAVNRLLFASSLNGQSTVFGKVLNFSTRSSNPDVLTSADVRYNAIFEVWKAFLERPLWGYGYQGLAERMYIYTHGMNTCTFLDWFAAYGLFYGAVAILGVVCFAASLTRDKICIALNIVILFVITMSENYIQHASIILMLFYGFYPVIANRRSMKEREIDESC